MKRAQIHGDLRIGNVRYDVLSWTGHRATLTERECQRKIGIEG